MVGAWDERARAPYKLWAVTEGGTAGDALAVDKSKVEVCKG